jgi:NitT/TauT family transport system ATP-binding protein
MDEGNANSDLKPHAAIAARNLSKLYPTQQGSLAALEGVSFDVLPNEFVSVVGPSGCGKSTLLKILAGLSSASFGEVVLDGKVIDGPRRDIGVVFQSPILFPWRNILENALLAADVQHLPRKEKDRLARELLGVVGLGGFEDRYPHELSGGMQQRVAIVRALINDPALMLMDEPFGALDAMTREQMNLEIQRIWQERPKTVIFITHSIPEAVFLGDRVFVMTPRPGRLAESIKIDLPRPRTLSIMNTGEFGSYVQRIRQHFHAQGAID